MVMAIINEVNIEVEIKSDSFSPSYAQLKIADRVKSSFQMDVKKSCLSCHQNHLNQIFLLNLCLVNVIHLSLLTELEYLLGSLKSVHIRPE
jgi:hypothetical protein